MSRYKTCIIYIYSINSNLLFHTNDSIMTKLYHVYDSTYESTIFLLSLPYIGLTGIPCLMKLPSMKITSDTGTQSGPPLTYAIRKETALLEAPNTHSLS